MMPITIIVVIICVILSVLLFSINDWLPKLRPDLYYIFNIFEDDLSSYKEHKINKILKGNKDEYTIDKNLYSRKEVKAYRYKNIESWFFKKGNSVPLVFQETDKLSSDLAYKIKNSNLDSLWFGNEGLTDFLKNYGILIILGVLVLLFIYLISQSGKTDTMLQMLNQTISRG